MKFFDFAEPLSVVLIDSAAKGTLLLVAAWLSKAILTRSSAALRHRVWGLTLGSLVLVAGSFFAAAGIGRLPILPRQNVQTRSDPVPLSIESESGSQTRMHLEPSPDHEIATSTAASLEDTRSTPSAMSSPAVPPRGAFEQSARPLDNASGIADWDDAFIAIVWCLGTCLFLFGFVIGNTRTNRLRRESKRIIDETIGIGLRCVNCRIGWDCGGQSNCGSTATRSCR